MTMYFLGITGIALSDASFQAQNTVFIHIWRLCGLQRAASSLSVSPSLQLTNVQDNTFGIFITIRMTAALNTLLIFQ